MQYRWRRTGNYFKLGAHYDVWHHVSREVVFNGEIVVIHMSWEYQHAGLLIKPWRKDVFIFNAIFVRNCVDCYMTCRSYCYFLCEYEFGSRLLNVLGEGGLRLRFY